MVWCDEAAVKESVPAERCRRGVVIRRALLRGQVSLTDQSGRLAKVLKSLVAAPIYTVGLPFFRLLGDHVFMQYLVRDCDHLGRLLAALGITPVKGKYSS